MDRIQLVIKLLKQFKSGDKKSTLEDYRCFIWVLCSIIDHLHTAKAVKKEWHEHLEVQLVNFSFNSSTLANLIEGSKLITHKVNSPLFIPDISSINVLGRAQIEQYLMINYLNFNPISESQGILRNLLFKASGLKHRQSYPTKYDEYRLKLEQEKKELEKVIDKIRSNEYFRSLPLQKQNSLLKTLPPREIGIEQFINSLRIRNTYYNVLWTLYSNYAHSEFISIIQSKEYYNNISELDKTVLTNLNISILTICLLIKDLTYAFKSSGIVYNLLPGDIKTKIEFYYSIANKRD